jgi:hypothetical protein
MIDRKSQRELRIKYNNVNTCCVTKSHKDAHGMLGTTLKVAGNSIGKRVLHVVEWLKCI